MGPLARIGLSLAVVDVALAQPAAATSGATPRTSTGQPEQPCAAAPKAKTLMEQIDKARQP
jgi:hypothetical protein